MVNSEVFLTCQGRHQPLNFDLSPKAATTLTLIIRNLNGNLELKALEIKRTLINNPNSVLIIEDAENIIMDRKITHDSSVSNLLNICDGLLSAFLNVQLICTFNNLHTLIDSALMRKGRLIPRYKFGKLGIAKAQVLSNHFGYDRTIAQPITIAEISNQHDSSYEAKQVQVMGFRKEAIMEN